MGTPDLTVHVTDKQLSALAQGINLSEIRNAVPELEARCNAKINAAEKFTELVKLVALKAHIDTSVLSTYITAVCNDTLKKKEAQAEQLTLLFDELAE